MSANLIQERQWSTPTRSTLEPCKPKRFHVSSSAVNRPERAEPIRWYAIPPVTDDEEMRFVKTAVIWMVVLAMIPLMLFHIITLFYPDIFMIPVAP